MSRTLSSAARYQARVSSLLPSDSLNGSNSSGSARKVFSVATPTSPPAKSEEEAALEGELLAGALFRGALPLGAFFGLLFAGAFLPPKLPNWNPMLRVKPDTALRATRATTARIMLEESSASGGSCRGSCWALRRIFAPTRSTR